MIFLIFFSPFGNFFSIALRTVNALIAKSVSSIDSSPILHAIDNDALVLTLIDVLNLARNASIDAFLARFRTSIKVRTRASLSISCKIGDESMEDADLATNAFTVLSAIEKKLPNGEKNIKKVLIKTTMGKPVKQVQEIKKKYA